jgi:hypothetical protein
MRGGQFLVQGENSEPTVTSCYEFSKPIFETLPNETTPDGIPRDDAAVGQFGWVALHETGHKLPFDEDRDIIVQWPTALCTRQKEET